MVRKSINSNKTILCISKLNLSIALILIYYVALNECDIAGLHIANFVGVTIVIVICPFHGMKISDYIPASQSWIYIFGANVPDPPVS